MLTVGDAVEIRQLRPGGADWPLGRGSVAIVASNGACRLSDGSRWRADGYAWGSKPTCGCGRSFEKRIQAVK